MESLSEQRAQQPAPLNLVQRVNANGSIESSIRVVHSLDNLDLLAAENTLKVAFGADLAPEYFKELEGKFRYAIVIEGIVTEGNGSKPIYGAVAIIRRTPIAYHGITLDHLGQIAVSPDYQNQGLATAILQEIGKQSPQGDFLRTRKGSVASEIYRRKGYELLGTTGPVSSLDFHQPAVIYDVFGRLRTPNPTLAHIIVKYLETIPPSIMKP